MNIGSYIVAGVGGVVYCSMVHGWNLVDIILDIACVWLWVIITHFMTAHHITISLHIIIHAHVHIHVGVGVE